MRDLQAWVKAFHTRLNIRGWRGLPLFAVFLASVLALPQARMILTAGVLGGLVIGVSLILARHQSGPRRGTPITLFPRPVNLASSRA